MNAAQATETASAAPKPVRKYRAGFAYISLYESWGGGYTLSYCKKAGTKQALVVRPRFRNEHSESPFWRESGRMTSSKLTKYHVEIADEEAQTFSEMRNRLFRAMGCPRGGKELDNYTMSVRGIALGMFGDRLPEGFSF